MSLFGSLQTASNTLQAMQIGLQVVGNNIANANTEGFIREQVNYAPAPVQEIGNLTIGLGVRVDSITQVIDEFLGNQLRDAAAERVSAELQDTAYKDLEKLVAELGDNDLSTRLTEFFGSIEDTGNGIAEDESVRNLAVLKGGELALAIRQLDSRAQQIRDGYDQQVRDAAGTINQLTEEIAKLNVRITQVEGGAFGKSDAGALRATRNQTINKLTELVDATVTEQASGGVSISVGGEFLVFEGQRREVEIESAEGDGAARSELLFTDTKKALELSSGRVHGLSAARDEIIDGFREDLDGFASRLINEFNRTHSQGQGLRGFTSLTSVVGVDDPGVALNDAGLPFAIDSGGTGSFKINVTEGGVTKGTDIIIKASGDGTGDDTTLAGVVAQIDAVEGLNASVGIDGRLTIEAVNPSSQFTFSGDDSGFLAAIGLNTFFTGSGASDIGINRELEGIENASKLALARPGDPDVNNGDETSTGGPSGTTGNANALAALIDRPLESLGGASIVDRYDQIVNELAQNSTVAASVAEGLGVFEATLANEFQAVSGVNIDEEAIDMISLQRIYQATARVIATIQEMLDTLVRL